MYTYTTKTSLYGRLAARPRPKRRPHLGERVFIHLCVSVSYDQRCGGSLKRTPRCFSAASGSSGARSSTCDPRRWRQCWRRRRRRCKQLRGQRRAAQGDVEHMRQSSHVRATLNLCACPSSATRAMAAVTSSHRSSRACRASVYVTVSGRANGRCVGIARCSTATHACEAWASICVKAACLCACGLAIIVNHGSKVCEQGPTRSRKRPGYIGKAQVSDEITPPRGSNRALIRGCRTQTIVRAWPRRFPRLTNPVCCEPYTWPNPGPRVDYASVQSDFLTRRAGGPEC
jgi:hypothetical protein